MPKEIELPVSLDRTICKYLVDRKDFPVLEVIETLKNLAQPHLMDVENSSAIITSAVDEEIKINRIIAPVSTIG